MFFLVYDKMVAIVHVKGTLHFRNNLGSRNSLNPLEERVCIKDSKFDHLHAKMTANIFAKKQKGQISASWKGLMVLMEIYKNGFF